MEPFKLTLGGSWEGRANMQPPEGWTVHDARWWMRQEQITSDRWLLFFYNFIGEDGTYPAAWANILSSEWKPGDIKDLVAVREERIQHSSMLELQCIWEEWRREILEGVPTPNEETTP